MSRGPGPYVPQGLDPSPWLCGLRLVQSVTATLGLRCSEDLLGARLAPALPLLRVTPSHRRPCPTPTTRHREPLTEKGRTPPPSAGPFPSVTGPPTPSSGGGCCRQPTKLLPDRRHRGHPGVQGRPWAHRGAAVLGTSGPQPVDRG